MKPLTCICAIFLAGCSQDEANPRTAQHSGSEQRRAVATPEENAEGSADAADSAKTSGKQIVFLGVPEDETSATGPRRSVLDVPEITEVALSDFAAYESAKASKRIVAEERHGEWIYWACDESLCLAVDGGEVIVGITERFKARVAAGD